MKPHALLVALFVCLAGSTSRAEVKLPAIFSDHMVVQADSAVPVWGWGEPGEKVTVTLAGQTQTGQAGPDGKWRVSFAKLGPGGPHTLTAAGKNTLTVQDVLVGEVWLASGQSNMVLQVSRGLNADQEKAAANFPRIRMFTVKKNSARVPQDDCAGAWEICSPATVENFSAVAYFFGRELHQALETPVGLINSSWGGTDIAAWTSEEAQRKIPELNARLDAWLQRDAGFKPEAAAAAFEKELAAWKETAKAAKAGGKTPPRKPQPPILPSLSQNCPANLYNGMIAPLVPYALRGAIWYQGEHNTATEETAKLYFKQLPLLIEDWRSRWGADFPMAWVQLPNYEQQGFRPLVREAMLQSLRVKNTGMAVTTDIGDPHANHPKNKQEVGRRLSLWALGTVYGRKVPSTSGPLPDGHKVQGDAVVLSFSHADGGLAAKGGELRGFEIAGADRQWKAAKARIDGETVVVSHPEVPQPTAARYNWACNPDGNLTNGAGLPASPLRTDDGS